MITSLLLRPSYLMLVVVVVVVGDPVSWVRFILRNVRHMHTIELHAAPFGLRTFFFFFAGDSQKKKPHTLQSLHLLCDTNCF